MNVGYKSGQINIYLLFKYLIHIVIVTMTPHQKLGSSYQKILIIRLTFISGLGMLE